MFLLFLVAILYPLAFVIKSHKIIFFIDCMSLIFQIQIFEIRSNITKPLRGHDLVTSLHFPSLA